MLDKLRSMIKFGSLVSSDDTGKARTGIMKSNGVELPIMILSPYGIVGNPPNGSLVHAFSVGGEESKIFGIIDDVKNRYGSLKKGEIGLYNYVTQTLILLKEDKSIFIDSKNKIDVVATTDINLTATGNVTIKGNPTITLDAQTVQILHNATIGGNLTVTGTSSSSNYP
jgi:phage gp45-like